MNKLIQRGVLGIADLTAAAGIAAGPGLNMSHEATPTAPTAPVAATQQVSVDKLLPNGVQDG